MQTCIVNVDKRHAFVKMISRNDAMAAKDGMERYRSAEMQLRVSLLSFFPSLRSKYFFDFALAELHNQRLAGVSALGPVIAATTKLASASFLSIASLMQIANGCCRQNMAAPVASQLSPDSSLKSRISRLVLGSPRKVTRHHHLLKLYPYTDVQFSNQQAYGYRQRGPARPALYSRPANYYESSPTTATLPSARAQR